MESSIQNQTNSREMPEGRVARSIEKRTARVPSDVFLWTALGSMAGSAVLALMGKTREATFVGQWVPTLLIFGLYNKIVKVAGHDRTGRSFDQPERSY